MPAFEPVETPMDFPGAEEAVLAWWRQRDVFARQVARNSADACAREEREHRPFVFYEGPPTANGAPHPGHVLTRVMKDVFLRFKAMQGFDVPRKAGWDTHGLPVEIEVERQLGIEGKDGIEAYGIEPFVSQCKKSVFQYADLWTRMTERIGFWIDLDHPYVTYHREYIESVWWALKTIWDAGLLYHGHKVVPYCPRCGTPLSSHEVGLGYRTVEDPSLFVAFQVRGQKNLSLLAWTTTPWTLLSNMALAVGPDYDYDYVRVGDETLVMTSALREACMGKIPHEVAKTVKGRELVGWEYEPLFDFARPSKPAYRVIAADFVGLDAGSGIVHIAPAFGEDDYRAAVDNDLPVVNLVEADGTFTDAVEPWKGRFVKDVDPEIIRNLRDRKLVLKAERYRHEYPFCWRCDSPLIYYARPAWYIRTTEVKDRMLANNAAIDWHPGHIRDGRFGNFLAANVDWALSRERYWGTPLPLWTCEACGRTQAVASREELVSRATNAPADLELHKPWVDEVTLTCPDCRGTMRRVPEVIDCWFDSGAMPFAQWGYPHASASMDRLRESYPAFFITEAIDQTRGWFYSLLAIATLLKVCAERQEREAADPDHARERVDPALEPFLATPVPVPYRRCLVLGHVCDEDGYKMSKSKGNYLDPQEVIAENGADAMRWYFFASNHPWVSVRFYKEAVRDAQKEFLVRLHNVVQFFVIYANIDGFSPGEGLGAVQALGAGALTGARGYVPAAQRSLLDRWILSKLSTTVRTVTERLDGMDVLGACQGLSAFVDGLSNWYVRRSRGRFWRGEQDQDKRAAYWTLYECLTGVSLLCAPFVPFTAEAMYRRLAAEVVDGLPESVHLHPWPEPDGAAVDPALEARVDRAREIASLGLSARASQKLKVRQPLAEAVVILADLAEREAVATLADVLADELNVKQVTFAQAAEDYVAYEVKPDFRRLGPRLGKDVQACAGALARMDAARVARAASVGEPVEVSWDGRTEALAPEDLDVRVRAREGYVAAQGPKAVVVLDTQITPRLRQEGLAREMVNRIQALRKELDLPYEARITAQLTCADPLAEAADAFADMIRAETLCADLSVVSQAPSREEGAPGEPAEDRTATRLHTIDGHEVRVRIARA